MKPEFWVTVILIWIVIFITITLSVERGRKIERHEAIKNKVAHYIVDEETGRPAFVWCKDAGIEHTHKELEK